MGWRKNPSEDLGEPELSNCENAVPAPLCEEWIQHLKSAPKGSCVIDLCAGYQSLKPHALAHGFNYIAVDLRGDRNTWSPVERTGGCQILR